MTEITGYCTRREAAAMLGVSLARVGKRVAPGHFVGAFLAPLARHRRRDGWPAVQTHSTQPDSSGNVASRGP